MKTSVVVAVVAVAAAGLYLLVRQRQAAAQTQLALGNVGGVAHAPDVTTGGVVSALGQVLPKLSTWFGGGASAPSQVPADPNTPYNGNSTLWNPVQSSPAVLPYSYKQQNIDTPALLGTNDLFTPSPVTGSSGAYADDSGGFDPNAVDYGLGD